MPDILQIREYMKKQFDTDKNIRRIPVSAPTVEEALKEASLELGVPVKRLEYEVEDLGNPGAFGLGKRNCRLTVWELMKEVKVADFGDDLEGDFNIDEVFEETQKDVDGEVIIRFAPEGVLMKITAPLGKGQRVTLKLAMMVLKERNVTDIDDSMVKSVVKGADSEYIKVGEFVYNPLNDASLSVDIIDFEMQATITATPPGPGGTDLTYDSIIGALKNNSVIHGYKDDGIIDFIDHPRFNFPVTIAEGTKPKNGADAKIIYNFESDTDKVRIKESDGKVNFKELNRIQNVVEGQLLAKKVPAEDGEDGRTVTGKMLPAKPGIDKELDVGKNVKLTDDGLSMIATSNGQVLVTLGKVNVEPVYIVQGDINMKTGNITHLGTVIVKGNVEDGFTVKASGNIEVFGTVGKCQLDAEGDIIVHQGITGKSEGEIVSGKTVWSKFIENANVQVGENVVATDGIINSMVDANKKVVCISHGKRAKIVGGRIRAAEEVIAETFGSLSGSETIVEVGYDPKSKAKLAELTEQKEGIEKEMEDLNLNIHTLAKQKKVRKKLPDDKEQYLKDLVKTKKEKDVNLEKINKEMEEIQQYLASLKSLGKVSAAKRVYPGVKIYIKEAFLNVRNEFKATTFINESGNVKMTRYEEPEEDYSRKD